MSLVVIPQPYFGGARYRKFANMMTFALNPVLTLVTHPYIRIIRALFSALFATKKNQIPWNEGYSFRQKKESQGERRKEGRRAPSSGRRRLQNQNALLSSLRHRSQSRRNAGSLTFAKRQVACDHRSRSRGTGCCAPCSSCYLKFKQN